MQRKNNHTSDRGTRPKLKISTNCPNLSNLSEFKTQCHKLLQSKHCITRRIWRKKKMVSDKNGVVLPTTSPSNILKLKDSNQTLHIWLVLVLKVYIKAFIGHLYTNGFLLFAWRPLLSAPRFPLKSRLERQGGKGNVSLSRCLVLMQ